MLGRQISEIRGRNVATIMIVAGLIGFSQIAPAQNSISKPVLSAHAEKFGKLQVQTVDGRFEPVHTMALDIMHKISRQDNLEIAGKGKMEATQIVLDMMLEPDFWKNQKIIYIREKSVQYAIGISGKYAAFTDFFDADHR